MWFEYEGVFFNLDKILSIQVERIEPDNDLDFHYFEEDSRQNSTEAISEVVNLLETGDFSPDLEQIYNDHCLVVKALLQGDIEDAKKIIRHHMQRVKKKIEKELFSTDSSNEKAYDWDAKISVH